MTPNVFASVKVYLHRCETNLRRRTRTHRGRPVDPVLPPGVALHGAFWHSGFGLVRSHGCVNLSPADARWLFGFLSAPLPAGWHAVMPGMGDAAKGSAVVVTP